LKLVRPAELDFDNKKSRKERGGVMYNPVWSFLIVVYGTLAAIFHFLYWPPQYLTGQKSIWARIDIVGWIVWCFMIIFGPALAICVSLIVGIYFWLKTALVVKREERREVTLL